MSIRCIWIVSVASENFGKVLFFRKYQTVERRAQVFLNDYVCIPSEKQFSISLLSALGLSKESKQFVDYRDRASKDIHLPAVSIKFKGKELWPIVIVEQNTYLLCCLPYASNLVKEPFQVSSISVAFSALVGIRNFLILNSGLLEEHSQTFIELANFLTLIMPFGEPSDCESRSVISAYNMPSSFISKQNTRKQLPSKGKSSIFVEINEFVRCAQSETQEFKFTAEVYGNINIKLESVSHVNELCITLEHSSDGKPLELQSIFLHPYIQTFIPGDLGLVLPKKLWLMPSSNDFTLCFYNACFSQPPIYGLFKMKGKSSVELFVQLKLNANVKNMFSFCEVFIPFNNQGTILDFEFKVTQGFLHVSEDKHSLKWNIGNKFASKSLDAYLTAKISLNTDFQSAQDDSFYSEKNAFIQINFKQMNETLSGCSIDSKSVTVSPPHKMKIFTDSSVQSTEYKIWNSLGDLPFPVISLEKWNQE